MNGIKIFGGQSNPGFVEGICEYLREKREIKIQPGEALVTKFSDGEPQVEIEENIRESDVFIVQSTCRTPDDVAEAYYRKRFPDKEIPVNGIRGYSQADNWFELYCMIDAAVRSSARRVTAVVPYYGCARQDKKTQPRVPFTARLVADFVGEAGAKRAIFMDLHAEQIQGFFKIPTDRVYASGFLLDSIIARFGKGEHLVVVSPDAGGVERARHYAKTLDAGLAIIDKRRPVPNQSEVMHVIGTVKDKIAIIVDDMCDTAGTLVKASMALMDNGAKEVHGCFAHPVFSGPAIERLNTSPIGEIWVSNSIPLSAEARNCEKRINVVSACSLIAEAIYRSHMGDSITSLFK